MTSLRPLSWFGRPSRALALTLALGSLAAVAARPTPSLAADGHAPRIAVVDLQRAVLETEDGLRAQSTLRKYFERRQAELNARQEELLKKKEDLEKQAKVLSKEALMQIVAMQVEEVVKRLGGKRITLTLGEDVLAWLAEKGYNPQYGARPLKRAIQDQILTPIASLMVGQGVMEGGSIVVSLKNGAPHFAVEKAQKRASRAKAAVAA